MNNSDNLPNNILVNSLPNCNLTSSVHCNTNNTNCVTSELKAKLIKGLEILPEDFVLTPVRDKKRPYRDNWQNEDTLSRDFIAKEINQGEAKGYGLRTGTISGGMVAVDADGEAAHAKLNEISQGNLPNTVAFTSGKPGRCQYLCRIPEQYWEGVKTRKINTGVKNDEGKFQQLELRWNGCQSVLPPSVHPETGEYKWVNSPEDTAIAEAPQWLIEAMLEQPKPAKAAKERKHQQTKGFDKKIIEEEKKQSLFKLQTHRKNIIECLMYLEPEMADEYQSWLEVGMALHSLANDLDLDPELVTDWNQELLEAWDEWSQQSDSYDDGCCEEKWETFNENGNIGIAWLYARAKECGWESKAERTKRERQEKRQKQAANLTKAVRELLDIKDTAESHFARREVMTTHGVDQKILDLLIQQEIERKYNGGESFDSRPQVMSLDVCFQAERPVPKPLVEGWFVVGGEVLITAIPGAGKTKLACDLACAIATGGKFLGAQAIEGTILFVSSDQAQSTTELYFEKMGAYEDDTIRKRVHIIGDRNGKKRWTVKDVDYLQEVVNQLKPTVVIIDSLRGVLAGTGIDENSAQVGTPMAMVNWICGRQGATVIWIHHANKDGKAVGIAKSAGSTDIPARVATHLHIDKKYPDTDKPDRVISVAKCRYFGEHTAEAVMIPSGRFELTSANGKSAEEFNAETSKRHIILSKLLEYPKGTEIEPLANELGFKPKTVSVILSKLKNDGSVKQGKSSQTGGNGKKLNIYALSDDKRKQLENTPTFSQPKEEIFAKLAENYTNAEEKDEGFDFESSIYNNPDLQLATPKGVDAEQEHFAEACNMLEESSSCDAVAGDHTAIEVEAVEVEEAAEEPETETEEPDTVTVDGITYQVGEVVRYVDTEIDANLKAKVVGKGWVIDDLYEGVTVEFLEGMRDSMYHINGNEWIIAPEQIHTTYTMFLSKIAIADDNQPLLHSTTEPVEDIVEEAATETDAAIAPLKPAVVESNAVDVVAIFTDTTEVDSDAIVVNGVEYEVGELAIAHVISWVDTKVTILGWYETKKGKYLRYRLEEDVVVGDEVLYTKGTERKLHPNCFRKL